jgi:hypothetical protein
MTIEIMPPPPCREVSVDEGSNTKNARTYDTGDTAEDDELQHRFGGGTED